MGFVKEFKEFALKGNVVDLAVAVIIGAAFGKIISSLIDDVITPLLLKPALDAAHLTNLNELVIFGSVKYGNFVAAIINFVIIALIPLTKFSQIGQIISNSISTHFLLFEITFKLITKLLHS